MLDTPTLEPDRAAVVPSQLLHARARRKVQDSRQELS